jgi:hypothetical protein
MGRLKLERKVLWRGIHQNVLPAKKEPQVLGERFCLFRAGKHGENGSFHRPEGFRQ